MSNIGPMNIPNDLKARVFQMCKDYIIDTLQSDTVSDEIKNDLLVAFMRKAKLEATGATVIVKDDTGEWCKTFILRIDRRLNPELIAWRKKVFYRDGYKCRNCNSRKEIEGHHIKSWKNFPELRYEVSNGLTLCHKCHSKTDNYGVRCKAITSEQENYALC